MSPETMAAIAEAINNQPYPPINLTKHYKGITLDQPVRIVKISSETATIQANQSRIFSCLDGKIHLRCGAFSGAIAGHIHPVDYAQGTFMVSDLEYSEWRERQTERVQPKTPIYIAIHYKRTTYRAHLEDISVNGMGILANKDLDPDGSLRVGAKVSLDFTLTPVFTFNGIKGLIVYRQKVGQQLIKFGLHLFPNATQKPILQRYIVQRHDEILDELALENIRIREPRRAENFYY